MTTPPTDMTGRVCIVTGSNTGIGRVTALELARMGAHVLLACRSQERTAPVVEAISMETTIASQLAPTQKIPWPKGGPQGLG